MEQRWIMAYSDSTFTKRPSPKKRNQLVESAKAVASDVAAGFGELKRQSGAAVENIKQGVRKIKEHMRR